MLDLQPGVHLQEVEATRVVEQELHRARALVADGGCHGQRGLAHAVAQRRIHGRRRRLLHDLLVPSLGRAVALAQVDPVPVPVEQDLDLHVARAVQQALQDQAIVAEGAGRLATGGCQGVGQVGGVADDVHPLPAPARGGLDQQREPYPRGFSAQRGVVLRLAVVAGQHRHTARRGSPASGRLVAHRGDRIGRRPHPRQAGLDHGAGEPRVLGEEAIAGVDRFRAGATRGVQDPGTIKVRADRHDQVDPVRRTVASLVDADGADPQPARGARDADGDLAAIGDEHRVDG